jgi:hypothetical protein
MPAETRSPEELFRWAQRCHRERHQACVHCARQHCVFFTDREGLEEYSCYQCGFCVSHDTRTDRYLVFQQPIAQDVLSDSDPELLDNFEDHPALRE